MPPKFWYRSTRLHRVTSQKTVISVAPRYVTNRLLTNFYPSLCCMFIYCTHKNPLREPNLITDITVLGQGFRLPNNSLNIYPIETISN